MKDSTYLEPAGARARMKDRSKERTPSLGTIPRIHIKPTIHDMPPKKEKQKGEKRDSHSTNCPCIDKNKHACSPCCTGHPSTQNLSPAPSPSISCLVPGNASNAPITASRPTCILFTIFSTAFAILLRLREPPWPAPSQVDHSRERWWGISLEYWKPWIRARVGMEVLAWKEKVAESE